MEITPEHFETIGRIEAKVDILLDRTATHDLRLRTVERRQWISSGVIAVGATFLVPKIRAFFGF